MGAALLSRLRPGPRLSLSVLAVLAGLLGSQASAFASAEAPNYDRSGYRYDVEANTDQVDTDGSRTSARRTDRT